MYVMKKPFEFPRKWIAFLSLLALAVFFSSCKTNEPNVEVLKRLYNEGINKQNFEIINSSLADNYVRHCQAMPPDLQRIEGKEKMMELFKGHFLAFPDWKEEIEIKAIDGNIITYLSKGTGTQTGQAGDLPPKGNKCELDHIIIHRFEKGKIAETWASWDNLTLLGQLGHYPPPVNKIEKLGEELMNLWETGDTLKTKNLFIKESIYTDIANNQVFSGVQEINKYISHIHSWASEIKMTTRNIKVSNEIGYIEWTLIAKQTKPIKGKIPIATNNNITLKGTTLIEVKNGKIEKASDYMDVLGFIVQLGSKIELPGGAVIGGK